MTFTNVLLICTCGIAACAALVFAVETLVAFCLHEEESPNASQAPMIGLTTRSRQISRDKAA